MNNPAVSVLMPAHNAEEYISEAIESILNQTFADFEFLITEDCSSDQTWEIIKKYSKIDSRITAIRNKKNLGIAGNRNKLISLAKGEYIAWQDADDISMLNRLNEEYKYMEKHPKVGIVGGHLQFFGDDGIHGVRRYSENDHDLRKNIFKFSPVAQPGAMIRKECFDKVGLYDLDTPPAEDLDMSFRIGTLYQFGNINKILLKYREHPKSATFSRLKKIERVTLSVRRKYSKHKSYHYDFSDYIYNNAQSLFVNIIPPKIKIFIFNKFRND